MNEIIMSVKLDRHICQTHKLNILCATADIDTYCNRHAGCHLWLTISCCSCMFM